MAAFKDIQAAITKLGQDISDEIAAVIAKLTPVDGVVVAQADIDAAVATLTDLQTKVEAETAALTAVTPPPTT